MTATTPARIVRVRCMAAAAGGLCHHVLGDVPGPLRFVSTAARRPDKPDGRIWLQCGSLTCRTWNVFELPHGEDRHGQ